LVGGITVVEVMVTGLVIIATVIVTIATCVECVFLYLEFFT